MIILQMLGGLGNQMFQYALGRKLALEHNTELKVDLRGYHENSLRKYCLDNLSVCIAGEASKKEISRFADKTYPWYVRRAAGLMRVNKWLAQKGKNSRHYSEKTEFTFDSKVLSWPDNIYVSGYFQSYKYFEDIRDVLVKEFQPKKSAEGINANYLKDILEQQSVSLHVRRGDYVSNAATQKHHGGCDLAYYKEAMRRMDKYCHGKPVYYVFSDDLEWVKGNLKFDRLVYFMDQNGADKDYEDLRLMSACQHHIIANSSFSWWGAWLCQRPAQKVIAPKVWIKANPNTPNMVPDNWERI